MELIDDGKPEYRRGSWSGLVCVVVGHDISVLPKWIVEARVRTKCAHSGHMEGCTTSFHPSASAMTDNVRRKNLRSDDGVLGVLKAALQDKGTASSRTPGPA